MYLGVQGFVVNKEGLMTSTKIWLPTPPSLNGIFRTAGYGKDNVKGRIKTKDYQAWIKDCLTQILMIQKIKPVPGPVKLELFVGGLRVNSDISNRIKAAEDALVEAKIIDGDDVRTVISVTASWAPDLVGAYVFVTPFQVRNMGRELWGRILPEDHDFYHIVLPGQTGRWPAK